MLLKTIEIDKKSLDTTDYQKMLYLYLRMVENHLNEIIRFRGYIYLNQICEELDVGWNPDDENPCVRNDSVDRFSFVNFEVFSESNNSFLINILRYD